MLLLAFTPGTTVAQSDDAVVGGETRLRELLAPMKEVGELERAGRFDDALKRAYSIKRSVESEFGAESVEATVTLEIVADIHFSHRDFASSIKLLLQELALSERFAESDIDLCDCIKRLGVSYLASGDLALAREQLGRCLKISKQAMGAESNEFAYELAHVASFLLEYRRALDAAPLLKESLAITEKNEGPDHPKTATALSRLGYAQTQVGDYKSAVVSLQRALAIDEKTFGRNHMTTAETLNRLALARRNLGHLNDALPLLIRTLTIYENARDQEDFSKILSALNNVALVQYDLGESDAAIETQRRALRLAEEKLGQDDPQIASVLTSLGGIIQSSGDFKSALPMLQRGLDIRMKSLGPKHFLTGHSFGVLSECYLKQGDSVTATSLLKKSLAITEEVVGASHPETARLLSKLSSIFIERGDYDQAKKYIERSLQICERVYGPGHKLTLMDSAALAKIQLEQGDTVEALKRMHLNVSAAERQLGPEHPDVAYQLQGLAATYYREKELDKAAALATRSHEIFFKTLKPNDPTLAESFGVLATFAIQKGDLKRAEAMYRKAISIFEQRQDYDARLARLRLSLAGVLQQSSNTESARELIDAAMREISRVVKHVLPTLTEDQQTRFLDTSFLSHFHLAMTFGHLNADDQRCATDAATWLINTKGVKQEAMAQQTFLSREVYEPVQEAKIKELLALRSKIANLAMSTVSPERAIERQQQIRQLSKKQQSLSVELSVELDGMNKPWRTWKETRTGLSKDAVFIDFFTLRPVRFGAKFVDDDPGYDPPRYVAWIMTPKADHPIYVDLGLRNDIDKVILQAHQQISSTSLDSFNEIGEVVATAQAKKELAHLTSLIWKRLENHVGDAKEIVLSPDELLWMIPWNALLIDSEDDTLGTRYLIEKYSLRYVTSARDLVAKHTSFTSSQSVLLADPDFGKASSLSRNLLSQDATLSTDAKMIPQVDPIPRTLVEARAIRPSIERFTNQEVVIHSGANATEATVKSLRSPHVLTLSTHGFYLPAQVIDFEYLSSIGFGSRDLTSSFVRTHNVGKEPAKNPLLRCGLLLAECNERVTSNSDDGILTGLEIVGIDLRGTDLVVLSACQSAVADARRDDRIAGLSQSFQLAGAKSVVGSIWNVEDRETADLMVAFFEQMARETGKVKRSKSASLREAQIERIKARRERHGAAHPFFWAPFILTGQD